MRTGRRAALAALTALTAGGLLAETYSPAKSSLFVRHVDPDSKVVSWMLKPGLAGHNQQSLYFTVNSMTEDGRFIVFDVSDDEFAEGFTRDRSIAMVFRRRKAVADLKTDRVFVLGGAFKGMSPFLDAKTAQLYVIDYEGVHRRDLAGDPQKDVLVCPLPAELRSSTPSPQEVLATHLTLTPDRRAAYLDLRSSTGPSRPGLLDFATGRFTEWRSLGFHANHGQISPVNARESIGAWERCWFLNFDELTEDQRKTAQAREPRPFATETRRRFDAPYPRVWHFTADGQARMISARVNNYATHENFTRDGRGVTMCCCRDVYHASGFTLHDLATDIQRDIVPYFVQHANLSPDGRHAAYDVEVGAWWRGCPWRVGFWDRSRHRGIWIHTSLPEYARQDRTSVLHPDPHPSFSPDGKYVVCTMFTPDRRMNISVTEVAELEAKLKAQPPRTVKEFPVAWDPAAPADVTWELEFESRRLEEEGWVDLPELGRSWQPYTAYAVEAIAEGRPRRLEIVPLKGHSWRHTVLRFRVPRGTTGLRLLADVETQFELRDTVSCDNLFAGVVEPKLPAGVADRRFETVLPESVRGKSVKLEWHVRNRTAAEARDFLRAYAVDRSSHAVELPRSNGLGGAVEPDATHPFFAEWRLPADAEKLVLEIAADGRFETTRLVLREGRTIGLADASAAGGLSLDRDTVELANRAAAWQIAHPVLTGRFAHEHTPLHWPLGAFYNGLVDWGLSDGDATGRFADYVRGIGEAVGWDRLRNAKTPIGHADLHCVFSAWLQLAIEDGVFSGRVDAAKECFDALLADRNEYPLEFVRGDWRSRMRWTWADALYMSPPAWTLLAGLSGEHCYIDHMVPEYQATVGKLFSEKDGLFYRDSTYLPGGKNNPGRDIFWTRGNGWCFAALALVLRDLPADEPSRPWFEGLFRKLARGVADRQQPDGSWHPDLADPKAPDCPEMSGTAFFAYAYFWGLNNGLLAEAEYGPTADRAWEVVRRATNGEGRLGWVQQIGSSPTAELSEDHYEVYATGALLSAAKERLTRCLRLAHPQAKSFTVVNWNRRYEKNRPVRIPDETASSESHIWDVRYAREVRGVRSADGVRSFTVNMPAGQRRDFLVIGLHP